MAREGLQVLAVSLSVSRSWSSCHRVVVMIVDTYLLCLLSRRRFGGILSLIFSFFSSFPTFALSWSSSTLHFGIDTLGGTDAHLTRAWTRIPISIPIIAGESLWSHLCWSNGHLLVPS